MTIFSIKLIETSLYSGRLNTEVLNLGLLSRLTQIPAGYNSFKTEVDLRNQVFATDVGR